MANSLFGTGFEPVESIGGNKALPADGYICTIMNAKIENTKTTGLPMVVIQFDIADGEYSNYYHKKFDNDKNFNSNPSYGGIARIPAVDEKGNAKRGFNSFCGAVEKSNDIKLPMDDTAFLNMLKGKMVGIIFGREEFQGSDGGIHWSTKPKFYRSVQTIESGDYTVPEDKYLTPSAPGFTENVNSLFGSVPMTETNVDSFAASEDDIPF